MTKSIALNNRFRTCFSRESVASIDFSNFKPGEFEKAVMFKIYIGNLENSVTLEQLKEVTASFTDIEDLVLVMDPETGESRCFAIAMFRDATRGQLLIETLSGRILNGRPMVVNEAVKKGKGSAAKNEFRRPQRGGVGGRGGENRPVGRQADFPSSGRPTEGSGFSGLGSMGGMSGPPRIPSRPPSGRPSSRPLSRGNSRGNFGNSPSGGSTSGSSGFARPNAPSPGPFRPSPPAASPTASSPETPKPIPQPPVGNVPPFRSPAPKPPVVRRLDTPPDQGNPSGA